MRRTLLVVSSLLVLAVAAPAPAGVEETLHNLSVSGPGEIRALSETEVCKFCHIPHSTVVADPLWGHALSNVRRYDVPEAVRGNGHREPFPQPDGASRLCLSCHDGTIALGDVGGKKIAFPTDDRLRPGARGYLGTDLSGSHPISFRVEDRGADAPASSDMTTRPAAAIRADPNVHLDTKGELQCTTCHDPHDDHNYQPGRVPHFWRGSSVQEVCLSCHEPK